jgi:hypothetical protein
MEEIHKKFHEMLEYKKNELCELAKGKTRKMTNVSKNDDINYSVKTTLSKINAEQDRKLKSSKAYKKREQLTLDTKNYQEEIKNEII